MAVAFFNTDYNAIRHKIFSSNEGFKGDEKKGTNQKLLICPLKYSRRESNPHVLRHWILNPTCLPIPPLERFGLQNYKIIYYNQSKIVGFMLFQFK